MSLFTSDSLVCATVAAVVCVVAAYFAKRQRGRRPQPASAFASVNWHFSRVCNYQCEFCYHVSPRSVAKGKRAHVSVDEGCKAISLLAAAGMKKLNFSGGEPFLYPKPLAAWCRHAKGLGLYVSIITNGSLVSEEWLEANRDFVDMIGVSVDSCNEETHRELGRGDASRSLSHTGSALQLSAWCKQYAIPFKVNTVVTSANDMDDMHDLIGKLGPCRWKVFQMLLIDGENANHQAGTSAGTEIRRDASRLEIRGDRFEQYVARHRDLACMRVEDNATMRNSYVILNEELKFLDNASGSKRASRHSILEVGVARAFEGITFDAESFRRRDGGFFATDMEDVGRG